MANNSTQVEAIPDGSFDWSGGVDSSKVPTLQSALLPTGLPRNTLAWLINAGVRDGGITQRSGLQPLLRLKDSGHWQGGFMYEPDGYNPYLVCVISGNVYQVLLEAPYTITDLSAAFGMYHPDTPLCWFCQGENYLVIQAGDFGFSTAPMDPVTGNYGTLPLIWDGTTLRRSIGITTKTPLAMAPNINEIPSATCMWYHGSRIWYAQARRVSAGDIAGGPSGTLANRFRDSILSVTENPLCFGGDGFSLPTNAGNIRALREEINLNESVANSRLLIWTRKSVFALSVPSTRADWISAGPTNSPLLVPIQKVNGAVGDRSVVPSNGDWFYQSFEPGIRSLITAVRYFTQWGNTPISQNENLVLNGNDRALMQYSSGIEFNNRMLQLALPEMAADGVNVVHRSILPLDFDVVSNMDTTIALTNKPVWEGAYSGSQYVQLFNGDFGGLPRAFSVIISDIDGSLNVWEIATGSRTENGDDRITWQMRSPAYTWSNSGLDLKLKQLNGGELWIDKLFGTVNFEVHYRVDADPCWRFWTQTQICTPRGCQECDPACIFPYPSVPYREGYRFPIVFPEPHPACDSLGIRPSTIGYQFQVQITIKGWCRIRGLMLYALPREKAQFQGVACPTSQTPQGMARLPIPSSFTCPAPVPLPPPPTPPPPNPPPPPAKGGLLDAQNVLIQDAGGSQIFGAAGD